MVPGDKGFQDLIHFTSISELPHSPFTGRIDVSVSMQDKTLLLLVGVVPVDVNLYLDLQHVLHLEVQ